MEIHYHRPPDREEVFLQTLVHDSGMAAPVDGRAGLPTETAASSGRRGGTGTPAAGGSAEVRPEPGRVLVTYLAESGVGPMTVEGDVVLEARAPIVWFTFPGAHHDIGRFHTTDGTFTGYYANILTPVELTPGPPGGTDLWHTTDLFLDLFVTPAGRTCVLDVDELDRALAEGWIEEEVARRAHGEAARLLADARTGAWPPPIVHDWPLERARSVALSGATG